MGIKNYKLKPSGWCHQSKGTSVVPKKEADPKVSEEFVAKNLIKNYLKKYGKKY